MATPFEKGARSASCTNAPRFHQGGYGGHMQARLPPIGDEARVAALCARCVFSNYAVAGHTGDICVTEHLTLHKAPVAHAKQATNGNMCKQTN
ncbi:hypothetical protein D1822_10955 [Phaeobacter inhibens]|nr:hypothetical protein D1822_10955 [Phaeobacter inhibens]